MSKLFDYRQIAENEMFVGRKDEVKHLSTNFVFLTGTAVVAPRGWGKSSLIHKAAQEAFHKEKSFRFCYVSLSGVRNEERFFELLAQSVLKAVSRSREDVLDKVKKFFPYLEPRISFASESVKDLNVDFDWEEIRRNKDMLLDIPQTVASELGLKLMVCIDDFHNISLFADSDDLLKRMESRWRRHESAGYCVAGEGNGLFEKFLRTTPLFYRYGEIIRLGRIRPTDMVKFIRERFADTAKYVDNEMAGMIVDRVAGNPFYIQQLAHLSLLGTSVVCSREVVEEAFSTMVDQMALVFENITDSLTTQQICYLHAILAGETVISTAEVMHRHHITSATSASRSKAALLERGIICSMEGAICFSDPVYACWLKHRFFNNNH